MSVSNGGCCSSRLFLFLRANACHSGSAQTLSQTSSLQSINVSHVAVSRTAHTIPATPHHYGQYPRRIHRADQPCGRHAGALSGPGAPSSSPTLSLNRLTGRTAKIWKGLQRKVRKAQDFVPVITATDVVEDKGDEVVRVAHFKEFHGQPPHEVREVCKSFYPTKV